MAKITRAQVEKWNAGMAEGWALDLQRLIMWNEKEPVMQIPLDAPTMGECKKYLQASLVWMDETQPQRNAYGQTFNVRTGNVVAQLHLSVYYKSEPGAKCATSHGLGQWIAAPEVEPQPRRSFAKLQKLTAHYDAARVLALHDEAVTANPYIFGRAV